jgi:hypothetical protein
MRDRKILKSLKYIVLTAAILIGATGVSNANPFTVTAEVGCDPNIDEGDSGTLDSVSVVTSGSDSFTVTETVIAFGEVEQNQTETLTFSLNVTGPTDCNGDPDNFTTESITVSGSAVDTYSCAATIPCSPFASTAVVGIRFTGDFGAYSGSIEFAHTP